MVRGLPGSGKSYLATALQAAIGKANVVLLDPDATDQTSQEYADFSSALTAEGVDEKFHPYRFLRSKAHAGITAHKIVIWNQAFTNLDGFQKTVKNLQTYAADHDTRLPLLVVEVEVGADLAKARVAKRAEQGGHDVAKEAFARFIDEYRSFAHEGYDTVIVNGEADVSGSVASIVTALQGLREQ